MFWELVALQIGVIVTEYLSIVTNVIWQKYNASRLHHGNSSRGRTDIECAVTEKHDIQRACHLVSN